MRENAQARRVVEGEAEASSLLSSKTDMDSGSPSTLSGR